MGLHGIAWDVVSRHMHRLHEACVCLNWRGLLSSAVPRHTLRRGSAWVHGCMSISSSMHTCGALLVVAPASDRLKGLGSPPGWRPQFTPKSFPCILTSS